MIDPKKDESNSRLAQSKIVTLQNKEYKIVDDDDNIIYNKKPTAEDWLGYVTKNMDMIDPKKDENNSRLAQSEIVTSQNKEYKIVDDDDDIIYNKKPTAEHWLGYATKNNNNFHNQLDDSKGLNGEQALTNPNGQQTTYEKNCNTTRSYYVANIR